MRVAVQVQQEPVQKYVYEPVRSSCRDENEGSRIEKGQS